MADMQIMGSHDDVQICYGVLWQMTCLLRNVGHDRTDVGRSIVDIFDKCNRCFHVQIWTWPRYFKGLVTLRFHENAWYLFICILLLTRTPDTQCHVTSQGEAPCSPLPNISHVVFMHVCVRLLVFTKMRDIYSYAHCFSREPPRSSALLLLGEKRRAHPSPIFPMLFPYTFVSDRAAHHSYVETAMLITSECSTSDSRAECGHSNVHT